LSDSGYREIRINITVIGTGYVGIVTGSCLAQAGHRITCVDIDAAKVARMQVGEVPIYEPGLSDVFTQAMKDSQLFVTTSLEKGVKDAAVIFLALPTPPGADGSADLSAVLNVADQLGPLLQTYTVIVNKSTVPVGTGEKVQECIAAGTDVSFDVISNPEFLREGQAIHDFMHPDRIVIGTDSKQAKEIMTEVYEHFVDEPEQLVWMDRRSAELTKYAANSFLAMKVSFMNEIANLAEKLGADVEAVRHGIGPDKRIGKHFLLAGIGYGGSCFPKDVQALRHTAADIGYDFRLLESIIKVNDAQKQRLIAKLEAYYKNDLHGKHFALWGLAFKPETDDIRESPALDTIEHLLALGATITAYDPEAAENTKKYLGERTGLDYADNAMAATENADALVIVTGWKEFKHADFDDLRARMKAPVIFDGRNIYSINEIKGTNFYYNSIGRPTGG
jgi:UDPglucose 6-dehydrogenase